MSMLELTQITVPIRWSTETRTAAGGLRVKGTAVVYGSPSHPLPFIETVQRGAFTRALAKPDTDIRLLRAHNDEMILARQSAGTLTVRDTIRGLEFEADIVPTSYGQDTALLVRTGHLSECSFGFTVADDEWSRDGSERTILEIGSIYELSLCDRGAYGATTVEGRSVQEIERFVAARRASGKRLSTRDRSSYGTDSEFSWFRDRARRDAHHKAIEDARGDPIRQGRPVEESAYGGIPAPGTKDGTLEDAERRLKAEERAQSQTLGNGGELIVPAGGVPSFLFDQFVTAVRAVSVLPQAMLVLDLPESGFTVSTTKLAGGALVSVDQDGAAVAEQDATTSLVSAPAAYLSGEFSMSRQLFDRGMGGNLDQYLGLELGAALGALLDNQILYGSGVAGQLLGLFTTTGVNTQAFTQASPTSALVFSNVAKAANAVWTANGNGPDTMIMAQRRYLWTESQADTATQAYSPDFRRLGLTPVMCPSMSITTGDGTRDQIALFRQAESPLFSRPTTFRTLEEPLSGTLSVRLQAVLPCAVMFNRRPLSIATISGTGLTTPVFLT